MWSRLGENIRQKFGQQEGQLLVNWSSAPVATLLSESSSNCCPARTMSENWMSRHFLMRGSCLWVTCMWGNKIIKKSEFGSLLHLATPIWASANLLESVNTVYLVALVLLLTWPGGRYQVQSQVSSVLQLDLETFWAHHKTNKFWWCFILNCSFPDSSTGLYLLICGRVNLKLVLAIWQRITHALCMNMKLQMVSLTSSKLIMLT